MELRTGAESELFLSAMTKQQKEFFSLGGGKLYADTGRTMSIEREGGRFISKCGSVLIGERRGENEVQSRTLRVGTQHTSNHSRGSVLENI